MKCDIVGFNKLYFISQVDLFADLTWLERRIIASRAYAIECKKGEMLYKKGDPPDALYCLVTGRAEAFTKNSDGTEKRLEYLYRGVYFGIISLLTKDPHSVNVRAINDSIVLKINENDFNDILKSIPRLAVHMSRSLSRRLKRKSISKKTVFESNIISVYSDVSGTGRTTYATNLAESLAKETSKQVILLDVSSSGKADLNDSRFNYARLKKTSVGRSRDGVDLLSIKHDPQKHHELKHITPLLTYLATDYHYILVDLPCRMDDTVFKALTQSDIIHIITNPDRKMLTSTAELITRLEESIPESAPKIKVIINEMGRKQISYKEERRILKRSIYGTIPPISKTTEYVGMIRRISRDIGGVLIGLAMGGGAAFGLIHIGVLKVLEREEIPVDIVAGSSMGAMIASLWAAGRSASEIEKEFKRFKTKLSVLDWIDPVFPRSGLIGGRKIASHLKRYLGNKTFQDVKVPLKITACDILRREVIVLDEGYIRDAVRASISIPGMLRPAKVNDAYLIDGGILEPVPIGTLIKYGAKKIIAVNPLPSPEDIAERFEREEKESKKKGIIKRLFMPSIFDTIVNTIQGMEYDMAERACQQADVVIHPSMADLDWYEFYKADEFIKIGESETERLLPEIKKLLEE